MDFCHIHSKQQKGSGQQLPESKAGIYLVQDCIQGPLRCDGLMQIQRNQDKPIDGCQW